MAFFLAPSACCLASGHTDLAILPYLVLIGSLVLRTIIRMISIMIVRMSSHIILRMISRMEIRIISRTVIRIISRMIIRNMRF